MVLVFFFPTFKFPSQVIVEIRFCNSGQLYEVSATMRDGNSKKSKVYEMPSLLFNLYAIFFFNLFWRVLRVLTLCTW